MRKGDLEGEKEKVLEVFEVEDSADLYIKRLGFKIVTFVEEISSRSMHRRPVSNSGRERQLEIRCCRELAIMPL